MFYLTLAGFCLANALAILKADPGINCVPSQLDRA
jgi:hypothetical protein